MFRMMQQFSESCNISADLKRSLADEISANDLGCNYRVESAIICVCGLNAVEPSMCSPEYLK